MRTPIATPAGAASSRAGRGMPEMHERGRTVIRRQGP
jgi:hypothetical protein